MGLGPHVFPPSVLYPGELSLGQQHRPQADPLRALDLASQWVQTPVGR